MTSTGHSGIQALLAGILRGDGNITAYYDSSAVPSSVTGGSIRAGNKGALILTLGSAAQSFTIPCLITKVNYKSEVAGRVEFNFDVSLDTISGAYAYPG